MSEQTPEQWARAVLEYHSESPQEWNGVFCTGCDRLWPCDAAIGARHVLAQAAALREVRDYCTSAITARIVRAALTGEGRE